MMLMGWSGGRRIRRIRKEGREEEVCKEFEETGKIDAWKEAGVKKKKIEGAEKIKTNTMLVMIMMMDGLSR